jgi:hypothetical protein
VAWLTRTYTSRTVMGLERQASPGDVSPPPRDLIHSIGMSDAVNPSPNNTQIAAAPSRCSNTWSIEMITRWLIDFLAIGLAGLLAALMTAIFACELCSHSTPGLIIILWLAASAGGCATFIAAALFAAEGREGGEP